MNKPLRLIVFLCAALMAGLFTAGCQGVGSTSTADGIVGAWRGQLQFTSGAYAEIKDLGVMYAFNAGGTMTESSNYDAAPPVPPAYGVWRKAGPDRYEARYLFYQSKAAASADEIAKTGGWAPGGHGVLTEIYTLSAAGDTYTSTVKLELFDAQGQPMAGGGDATGRGARIKF